MVTSRMTMEAKAFNPADEVHRGPGVAQLDDLDVDIHTPEGWITGHLELSREVAVLADFSKPELRALLRRNASELRYMRTALHQMSQADLDRRWSMATAGHDLRQPLQIMVLALDSLRRRPDRLHWVTEVLRGEVLRLRQGLDQLATAARAIPEDVAPQALEPVRLMDLFDIARERWAPIANAKGLTLRVVGSDLKVMSDPLLLSSITDNLVGNAIKYTDRGDVLLGCRRTDLEVRLEVVDTGIGFDPAELAALIRPFFQADSASEGLGLGLALVSRAAERLGHRLSAHSRPGQGTRFTVIAERA